MHNLFIFSFLCFLLTILLPLAPCWQLLKEHLDVCREDDDSANIMQLNDAASYNSEEEEEEDENEEDDSSTNLNAEGS